MNASQLTLSQTRLRTRVAAAAIGVAAAGGILVAGAGAAHAGTVPVTNPSEPSVAMTITNHTDKTEYLGDSGPNGGQWVQAPQRELAPGASETVVAVAPGQTSLKVNVNYHVGLFGPTADYSIENMAGNTNLINTGVYNNNAGHYMIDANIASSFPNANVTYDLV